MRVLFVSYAEKTHFLGMVPLAWALRSAGHEVVVASQPELMPTVAATGLPAVAVGNDHVLYELNRWTERLGGNSGPGLFDVGQRWPEETGAAELLDGYGSAVSLWWKVVNDPMVDELTVFCRQWRPDLVLWEPVSFAGAVAAEAVGAVHGRVLWGMDLLGRMRGRFLEVLGGRGLEGDPLARWLGDRAQRVGVGFSERMTRGFFTLDPLPQGVGLGAVEGVERVPVRYVPYNGRAVVPEWLRGGRGDRPRVCVTLGTSAVERLGGYAVGVEEVLEGVAGVDAEVVAALPGYSGRVPSNVRVVPFVPLHALVPGCAVLVNHGGPGTLLTGLSHGVPQVLLPGHHLDEPLMATRFADLGAAVTTPADRVSGAVVRAGVERVLAEGSFARSAGRLRGEMAAMPSPGRFAAQVEDLVEHHRGRAETV